jgi:tRNA1Val (adenine37-N6)-methyltransferase
MVGQVIFAGGMSNTYFQFKQFTVHQDQCAMKVTTDACIMGAWTPVPTNARNVLDVGAGTGLLSLMLAQRFANIRIDAVEIDPGAAGQAASNFEDSPWSDRLKSICTDAAKFETPTAYDLLITNPPFFRDSLRGPNHGRNTARHDDSLNENMILELATRFLAPTGMLCVLLPVPEFNRFQELFKEHGWQATSILHIRHTANSAPIRNVGIFSRGTDLPIQEFELVIKNAAGVYTTEFTDLLRPFYLYL